jgi:hypothetical protein
MSFGKSSTKTANNQNTTQQQTQTQQQQQQQAQDQSQVQASQQTEQQQQQQQQQQTQQQTQQQVDQQTGQQTGQQVGQQAQAQSETANNLDFLKQGWASALALLTGQNPTANGALNTLNSSANAGVGASNSALDAINSLVHGGASNGANPILQAFAGNSGSNAPLGPLVTQISQALQPQIDGQFGAAGRYGSGANANAFGSALTNAVGNLTYQNYNDSMNRGLTATQQLSQNGSNSTNAVLQALGLVPNVAAGGIASGQAGYGGAIAPVNSFADLISRLGSGGSNVTGTTNNATNTVANNASNGVTSGITQDITNAVLQLLSGATSSNVGAGYASGSGTSSGSGTASGSLTGNTNGTGSSTTTSMSFAPKFSLGPLSFGG